MSARSLLQDYHMHSTFSIDSRMSMTEACEQALRLGLAEICFTEHVDYVPGDAGTGFYDPEAYFAELRRCRDAFGDRLLVRAGVEIGEAHRYPDKAEELTSSFPFDFVIGSLHWVGPNLVMTPEYFEGRSRDEAYTDYFEEMFDLVEHGGFDVVGHLDVPKRYEANCLGNFDAAKFAEPIRAVLKSCVDKGIGIEINTGTMRRTGNDPSPSPLMLRWYRELGGEVLTLGSDAHRPTHIAYEFGEALDLAQTSGFTHLTTFERRRPTFKKIV